MGAGNVLRRKRRLWRVVAVPVLTLVMGVLLPISMPITAQANHGDYYSCGPNYPPDCAGTYLMHWAHTAGVQLTNNIQFADCMQTNTAAWHAAFQARVTNYDPTSWSWVSSLGLLHTTGCYNTSSHPCSIYNNTGIIPVCSDNWSAAEGWPTGAGGLWESALEFSGGQAHIVGGRVRLQDSASHTDYDRQRVVGQETGHGFGLGHTATCSSIQSNPPYCSPPSNIPNAHDESFIDQIYNGHQP